MKLTRSQLRRKIDREIERELINEGILDSIENYATIAMTKAFPGLGNTAAFGKAITVDLARVAKDMSDLGKLLKPFGMDDSFNLLIQPQENVLPVAQALYNADPRLKEKIKEEFYELAESIKKLVVSLNSANPEPLSSFVAGTTFATMPLERILIDAAPALGEIFAKIQTNWLGNFLMGIVKLGLGIVSLGIFGIILNDPVTFFENLGMIVGAVLDEGKYTHLFSSVVDSAGEVISLTENKVSVNRMQILAGIK